MKILGLQNCAGHDPAAAILTDDGDGPNLKYALANEERLLRCKNSYQFPLHAFVDCMDRLGIETLREIDYLVTDYSKIPRWINSGPHYRKLLHDYIKLKLDFPEDRILVQRHHDAHAATAYYPSGYNDAAVLVIDGVGSEHETTSLYRGSGTRIQLIERTAYYGVGALYDIVTVLLGFVGNHNCAQPGKTMGLAPYGAGVPGPVLNLAPSYDGLRIDYSEFMSRLPFYRFKQPLVPCPSKSEVTNAYYARIAYELQEEFERAYLHLAKYALERTGSKNLVISGGTGLNCVANGILIERMTPEGFYVYPACHDEGIAIGAALYAYYNMLPVSRPKTFSMPDAYTGRVYESSEIRRMLERLRVPFEACVPGDIAERIAAGKIVGWFTGGSESGPRALGHRSILADPRDPGMKDLINSRIKHRESFRPFAPSVLEEHAAEFFDLDRPSPYMLLARPVRPAKTALIPAVVHVDGTSRIQTVSPGSGNVFYDVIEAFHRLTGIPMLLNTSFNDNNEPIVETPEDALLTFLSTQLDALYLEGFLIEKARLPEEDIARIVRTLRSERAERRRVRFADFVRRCCRGWDTTEIEQYHNGEMVRGLWHRHYEALETLERFIEAARATQRPIALVGTRDHTKLLAETIPGFSELNIVRVQYLPQHDWEDIAVCAVDKRHGATDAPEAVLITTYEWEEQATHEAGAMFGPDVEIVNIYRPWSEDIRFVIGPLRQPAANVAEYRSSGSRHSALDLPEGEQPTLDDPGERVFFGQPSNVWPSDQSN